MANKVWFFVNGVADRADGLTLSGTALSTGDMIIGRHRNANEGQFSGLLDEVRIYNKVLTAEEAAALYDATCDAYAVPPTPPVDDITLTVDAADLIEYLNASVGTNPNGGIDWAAVRAANAHEAPYNVRYFEIGNEMQQA